MDNPVHIDVQAVVGDLEGVGGSAGACRSGVRVRGAAGEGAVGVVVVLARGRILLKSFRERQHVRHVC